MRAHMHTNARTHAHKCAHTRTQMRAHQFVEYGLSHANHKAHQGEHNYHQRGIATGMMIDQHGIATGMMIDQRGIATGMMIDQRGIATGTMDFVGVLITRVVLLGV